MTTMIERVARAIAGAIDEERFADAPGFQKAACAAIAAMREPTEGQKAEIREHGGNGAVAWWIAGHYTAIDAALEEKP